eukprot:15433755-Alexandrium_andersonii.AAC.1
MGLLSTQGAVRPFVPSESASQGPLAARGCRRWRGERRRAGADSARGPRSGHAPTFAAVVALSRRPRG